MLTPIRRLLTPYRILAFSLVPALAAIWLVPGFFTQDGPAHVYNAHILAEALRLGPESPFHDVFEVRWAPLPNLAGHLLLMGLMSINVPARVADQALMTLTLAGFAASIVWLKRQLGHRRSRDQAVVAMSASLLSLSFPWLLGFYNFILGACLLPVTLGVWWNGRERMGPGRVAALAALLTLGYFCHLVSAGLTALGLTVLALATPASDRRAWWSRLGWTALGLLVLVPLGLVYRSLVAQGGPIEPVWGTLKSPASLSLWKDQLGWVDPLSLASRYAFPFTRVQSFCFLLLSPMFLLLVAWTTMTLPPRERVPEGRVRLSTVGARLRSHPHRAWWLLAFVLVLAGICGPDTLGPTHGNYLPQRILLAGLAILLAVLPMKASRPLGRLGAAILSVALVVQSAFVWDYALTSQRLTAPMLAAVGEIGRQQRVGSLLLDLRGPFRANPLLHVDNLLGVGTGNILWNNYEAAHYYFPVHVRTDVPHPPALAFEEISILDDPDAQDRRAELWNRLLANHRDQLDVLIIRGTSPSLDPITAFWGFASLADAALPVEIQDQRGLPLVRVLQRRPSPEGPSDLLSLEREAVR